MSTGVVKQVRRPCWPVSPGGRGPAVGKEMTTVCLGAMPVATEAAWPILAEKARSARRFRRELLPCRHGAVAQWSEQGTHNPSVVGSIPTSPTSPTRSEGAQGVQPADPLEAGEIGVGADDGQAVLECERCERCVTDQVASEVEIAHEPS